MYMCTYHGAMDNSLGTYVAVTACSHLAVPTGEYGGGVWWRCGGYGGGVEGYGEVWRGMVGVWRSAVEVYKQGSIKNTGPVCLACGQVPRRTRCCVGWGGVGGGVEGLRVGVGWRGVGWGWGGGV